ncbi:MAG: hypothetical protein MUC49_01725 [Raineya sp.]|jgi:hypothetical protein|nr:hypothetical protein [Raineya sp.]
MIYILLSWLNALFVSFIIGKTLLNILFKYSKIESLNIHIALQILLGFIGLNFLVDALGWFFPINIGVQITIEIIALFLWVIAIKKKWFHRVKISWIDFILGGGGLYMANWVLIRCVYPTSHYDEGLYYIQHVRWLQEFGFVKGLGNLHVRLAFNSNWHNLATFFNYPSLTNIFFNDLNGLVFIVAFWYSLSGWKKILNNTFQLSDILKVLFTIPLFHTNPDFVSIYSYIFINTISPDWASYIFVAITFILFVESFEMENDNSKNIYFIITSLFAIYAFTIKIANILILIIPLYYLLNMLFSKKYQIVKLWLLITTVSIIPWIGANIILSGYLLFPVGALQVSFLDWATSKAVVTFTAEYHRLWTRTCGNIELYNKLTFKELSLFWYEKQNPVIKDFYHIFFYSVIGLIILFFIEAIRYKKLFFKNYGHSLLLFIICIAGTIFWFLNAPDFRFSAVFLIFCVILLAGFVIINLLKIKYFNYILLILGGWGYYEYYPKPTEEQIKEAMVKKIDKFPIMELQQKQGIYVPTKTDQCFDTSLPCAPEYEFAKGKIEQIDKNNIGKGFILK